MTISEPVQRIHVACGQIVCTVGDIGANLKQMDSMARAAARHGARLILFGEGALTGYLLTEENLKKAPSADSRPADRLRRLSRRYDIVMAAGTIERSEQGLHVSHFIVFPDGRTLVQRKNRLTPKELNACIVAGPEDRIVFEVDGVRFAVCICADSGIPDIKNRLARQGCHVYLGPTAGGGGREFMCHAGEIESPERRARYIADMAKVCFLGQAIDDCLKHHMALACVNLAGDDGVSNYHPGHTGIIDSFGKLVDFYPGEYVVEFLQPRLIHGVIAVRPPREHAAA